MIKRFLTKWLNLNVSESETVAAKGDPMYQQIETVDKLLAASRGKKLMVLKHSSTCPISSRAKRELDSLLADKPAAEVYLVVVQERRDLSSEIAEKLGVRHESPQLLLIQDGKVTEHWSHHYITRDVAETALG